MSRLGKLYGLIGAVLILIILSAGNVLALTNERESKDIGRMHILSDDPIDPNGPKVSAFSDKWVVTSGDTFTVRFCVNNVDDFYGASLDLKFDENLLKVVSEEDITPGDIFDGLLGVDEDLENPDYVIMISPVSGEYDGEEGLTIGDVNEVGVINFVALLLGKVSGQSLNDGNWHSFVDITFKVKDNISFNNGDEYLPIEFLFDNTLPDNFTDATNNGTAIIKLADSNDVDLEGGINTNKILYQGLNVGGLILPPLQNGQYRAVLEWDWDHVNDLRELDAHMLVPGGDKQIDVSWKNEGSLTESPEAKWIGDFNYDQDRNYCIPAEVITFNQTTNGTYDFFVDDYDKERFNGVNPRVFFYDSNGIKAAYDFEDALNKGKGSVWDVFSFTNGIITPVNAVRVEKYVDISLPGEPDDPVKLIENDQYSISFNVTLNTDNFDSLNLGDVKIKMFDQFNTYEGEYVSGPNEGSFQFRFPGVRAGDYHLAAKVQDVYYERENIMVDSFQSKPVAYQVTPWVVPIGDDYYRIGLRGYGLDKLNSDTIVVKLVNPLNQVVVASTETDEDEDWLGVNVWDEGNYKYMDIQLKAEGKTIPPGEYDVVISDSTWDSQNPIWVQAIGKRFELLKVTDQPALTGDAYPWVLGANLDDFSLWFEGINLQLLTPVGEGISVELLGDNRMVIGSAHKVAVKAEGPGPAWIRADFSGVQDLSNQARVYPVIKYNGNLLLGGDRFDVQVADYPVVYGLEKDQVLPGKTLYRLVMKGWNLDINKDYRILVDGQEPIYQRPTSSTDLPFDLTISGGLEKGGYNINVYEKDGDGEYYLGSVWLRVEPIWVEPNQGGIPIGYDAGTTLTLNEGTEFDVWSASDQLVIKLFKDGNESNTFSIDNAVVTDNQVTFTLPDNLPLGSYRVEVAKGDFVIAESRFDVYAEPSVTIEVIGMLSESDVLSADFGVVISAENIDLRGINPNDEIKVRMFNEFNDYEGSYDGTNENIFLFNFIGVQAGNYHIEAWVRDGYGDLDVDVDSYENAPVVYRITPWAVPTGNKDYNIRMLGYGLELLKTGTKVEIKDALGNIVASTVGTIKTGNESNYQYMEVQLEAKGGTILPGPQPYDVVITNINNWNETIGNRYNKLYVTDQPALRGDAYPWVLGTEADNYSLRFEGINLDLLNKNGITVQLLTDDLKQVIATASNIEIEAEDKNYGLIRAYFSDAPLPSNKTMVHPVVKYLIDGKTLPGADHYDVKVVDYPVVYGLINDRVIPGKMSYDLLIKGWNLDISKEYRLEVNGDNEVNFDIFTYPNNNTDIPFNLVGAAGLKNGWYSIDVFERYDSDEEKHIGTAWLNAEPEWIEVTPNHVPVGYPNTTMVLKEDLESGCDIWSADDEDLLKVRLTKDDTLVNIVFDTDGVTDNQVTFTLAAGILPQGNYHLELIKDNISIAQSRFDVYAEPSVTIGMPDSLIEGIDGSGITFDAAITTQNINLEGFSPDRDADVWMYGEFNNYKGIYDAAQSELSSGLLVFRFTGVQAGDYDLMVKIRDGFDETKVKVNSYDNKPIVYRIQPRVHPAENKYFGFDLQGYNLQGLSIQSVVELLYKYGPNAGQVAATTAGDDNWPGIGYQPQNSDCISVNMKAIGDKMLTGFYELRITDTISGFDSDIGLRVNTVEFTEEAVLTGVEPNPLGAGIDNYSIKIHGMNLDRLSSANLLVLMESKDQDGAGNAIWSKTGNQIEIVEKDGGYGYIRATFTGSNPIPQDEMDLKLIVKENGISIRMAEEIWVRTTTEPVVYGVTPTLLSPGKTSYSFILHGWNIEDFVLDVATSLVEVIRHGGSKMTLNSYDLSDVGENKVLNVSFNDRLDAGDYDLCINDITYGYPGRYVCRVSFDVEPGDTSVIQPSTGTLEEGYTSTAITIKDETATSYIWEENDDLDVRFIEPTVGGPLIADTEITNIQVASNTIEFTLGSGLPENLYSIEVLRNGVLIGEGAEIRVIDAISVLTITTGSLPIAKTGESYFAKLEAVGGTQPYNWSLAQGSSLPNGLDLSTDGTISGIANQEGEVSFSVQVIDNQSESATKSFTIEVLSSSHVVVSVVAPDKINVGSTFIMDVYVSGLENKNLVTADVQIKFDPNKLSIVDDGTGITIGTLLGDIGRDIIKNEYDNLNGTVWFGISNTNGTVLDSNGGGVLVSLKFIALTEGTSVISFKKINSDLPSATSLIDVSVNDIQHSVNGRTLEIISGITLSGKVLLQGRTIFGDSIIRVVDVDSSNSNQYQGYTQSDGTFIFNGISPGKYRVTAEHTSYLKTDLMILNTSSETSNIIIPDCQLLAGDTDGDGVIFTKDVTRIKLKYGSSVSNDPSDLDGDGIIFTKDVTRVKLNYGKSYVPLTIE